MTPLPSHRLFDVRVVPLGQISLARLPEGNDPHGRIILQWEVTQEAIEALTHEIRLGPASPPRKIIESTLLIRSQIDL